MDKDLFENINIWNQLGFLVTYDIVNQIENGSYRNTHSESQSLFTYTFYITPYGKDYIFNYSVDDLLEGYETCLEWLASHKSDLLEEHLSEYLEDYNYLLSNNRVEVHSYESENTLKYLLALEGIYNIDIDYKFDSCVIEL